MTCRFIRSYAYEKIEKKKRKRDLVIGKHDQLNNLNIQIRPTISRVYLQHEQNGITCLTFNRNLVPKIFSLDPFMLLQKWGHGIQFLFRVNEVKAQKNSYCLNDLLECAYAQQFCSPQLGTSPMCHAAKCCRHSSPTKKHVKHNYIILKKTPVLGKALELATSTRFNEV